MKRLKLVFKEHNLKSIHNGYGTLYLDSTVEISI